MPEYESSLSGSESGDGARFGGGVIDRRRGGVGGGVGVRRAVFRGGVGDLRSRKLFLPFQLVAPNFNQTFAEQSRKIKANLLGPRMGATGTLGIGGGEAAILLGGVGDRRCLGGGVGDLRSFVQWFFQHRRQMNTILNYETCE